MHSRPPFQEQFGTPGWLNWFTQVFLCLPWKKGINQVHTINFPSVPANNQHGLSVTVEGAREGDAVSVTPYLDTVGILYKAIVTDDNEVTVFACNFTAGAVNPPTGQFRIIVIQN